MSKAPERMQTHKLGSPSHAPSNSGDEYQQFPAPGNTHHHRLTPVVPSCVGEIPCDNHQHHPSPITQKNILPTHLPLCREQVLHHDTLVPEVEERILIKNAVTEHSSAAFSCAPHSGTHDRPSQSQQHLEQCCPDVSLAYKWAKALLLTQMTPPMPNLKWRQLLDAWRRAFGT